MVLTLTKFFYGQIFHIYILIKINLILPNVFQQLFSDGIVDLNTRLLIYSSKHFGDRKHLSNPSLTLIFFMDKNFVHVMIYV